MASTIKVDNVQNQPGTNIVSKCGTTITLGASSDTVALAAGATQTGFGRTGTVDWVTTPKVTGDSPLTGVTGKGYFLNTTAGTITVNLPAGAAGSIISMADYARTWDSNNVTITPNGVDKIGGINDDATLDTEGQSVTFVYIDSTQGWLNVQDSTSNVRGAAPFIAATGGTPCAGATVGDYKVHTFTGPGTFCVTDAGTPAGSTTVDYLVIAGGGAGGDGGPGDNGGGGGAGGYRESVPSPAAWTSSPIANPGNARPVTVQGYPIVVGGGGTTSPKQGGAGVNSTFSDITSTGGGGGAANANSAGWDAPPCGAGGSGGGGRGGGGVPALGGPGNNPPVSPAQGLGGGVGGSPLGPNPQSPDHGAGGGGGATTVGGNSQDGPGGNGGPGAPSNIDNTPAYKAGGGGGGSGAGQTAGAGGTGGGGRASNCSGVAVAGTVNTGGGGGGGNPSSPGLNSAAGGSGIVILRYKFQ